MAPEKVERMLARIDAVVGRPDDETEEDRARRRLMVERDAEARRIRKAAAEPQRRNY